MWSLRELAAGLKEVAFHELRNWLKIGAYVTIWASSFVLTGSVIEVAIGEEFHQVGFFVALVAATTITYLVIFLKHWS